MDLSRFSTEDLKALRDNDLGRVSTEGLKLLQSMVPAEPVAAPRQSTITGEGKRGLEQLVSSTVSGIGAIAGSPEEAARRGLERGKRIATEAGEGPSFERLQRIFQEKGFLEAGKAALGDVPRVVAGQVSQLGAMAAGAKLGAMTGTAVAPFLGPAAPAAPVIGGGLGALAALAPSVYGQMIERQAAEQQQRGEPIDIQQGRAAAATAGSLALEVGGTATALGKSLVKKVLGVANDPLLATRTAQKSLESAANRSLSGAAARGVGRGAAVEMPVEVAQTVIERAQAGLPVTGDEAFKEYGEAAYLGGVAGGALGGAGGVYGRGAARRGLAAQEEQQRVAREAELDRTAREMGPPEQPPAQAEMFERPRQTRVEEAPTAEERGAEMAARREEFDRLQRENQRLKSQYDQETDPAKKAELYAEAEKLAPQLRAVSQELKDLRAVTPKEAPGARRPTTPEGQLELPLDGTLRLQDLPNYGIPMEGGSPAIVGVRGWLRDNVLGKTPEQVRRMTEKQPDLLQGKGLRARVLKEMIAPSPQPQAFQQPTETPSEPRTESRPAEQPELDFGGTEPSVGVSGEPAAAPVGRVEPTEQPKGAEPTGLGSGEPPAAGRVLPEVGERGALEGPPLPGPEQAGPPLPGAEQAGPPRPARISKAAKAPIITPERAAEEWDDYKPDDAPAFDRLPESAQKDWTARVAKGPLTMQDADEVYAKEKAAKEKAEKEAKEKAEKEAKEKAAKEKAEKEAKEKAEKEAKEKAEKEAKKDKKPVEKEVDEEAADEARQKQAEDEVDAGPIGQAIQRLEDGDFETKSAVKRFAKSLEKRGIIDDTSEIDELVSDRDADVSDVIAQLTSQLEDARDNAIDERKSELDEEAEEERQREEAKRKKAEGREPPTPRKERRAEKPAAKPEEQAGPPLPGPEQAGPPSPIAVRKGTPKQLEIADTHQKSQGGDIVWQDGEYALLRIFRGTDPVYIGINQHRRTLLDITEYDGDLIPLEVQGEMKFVKRQLEKEAAAKHTSDPFIKFDKDGLALSEGISAEYANIIREWKKLLKINGNVYVTTIQDGVENKDNFTGPHRIVGFDAANASVNMGGGTRQMADGSHHILVKLSPKKTQNLETLAHEMGHIHQREVFDNAPLSTRSALRAAHFDWLNSLKGKTAKELIESMRGRAIGVIKGDLSIPVEQLDPYWHKFNEWYADQVARWAVSSDRPVTVVEKFFARLGASLRKFYNTLKAKKYLPNETFAQYIEAVTRPDKLDLQPMEMRATADKTRISQTETPAFKRWFGDSKVVDENGNPLVVYHGTTASDAITQFKSRGTGNEGIWFGELSLAEDFATKRRGGENAAIYPVYLVIKKPAPSLAAWNESAYRKDGKYDGFIGEQEDGRKVYAVLDRSSQAKSAIGNIGTFDPSDYRIDRLETAVTPPPLQQGFSPVPGGLNKVTADAVWEGILKLRTQLVDKGAYVFDRIAKGFNDEVNTALKGKQVEAAFRQAEASDQFLPQLFRLGAMIKDKITGQWEAVKKANIRPPAEIIDDVRTYAKDNDLDFDAAYKEVSDILQAAREHTFREHNATRPKGAQAMPRHMPDDEVDRLYPIYQSDATIKKIVQTMDKVRFDLIDHLVDVGRIPKELGQEWKDASNYIPFDRLVDLGTKPRTPQKRIGRGIGQLGKLPELVDAELVSLPPKNTIDNYFGTIGWMAQQVIRQDATLRTLRALEDIGEAKLLPTRILPRQMADRVATAYIKGEERYFEVTSPYHKVAFNMMSAPTLPLFKVFQRFSQVLRHAITAVPTFTAAQLPQDIQRAIMYSGVQNPAALTAKVLANFKDFSKAAVLGKLTDVAPELGTFGVVGGVDFHMNDPTKTFLIDMGVYKDKLLRSTKFATLLKRLEGIAMASDIAMRKAIYDQTLEETQGDRLQALTRAREIINFRRFGAGDKLGLLHLATQTVPFYNAYLQGTDVLFRSLTGKNAVSGLERNAALKHFYKNVGYLMAASTVYAMMMADEEDYENMDLRERDRTWVIGGGIGIPVAPELGVLFKAIPERVVEYYRKAGTPEEAVAMEAIIAHFKTGIASEYFGSRSIPIPVALKPLLEVWTNYSFLTGRELEGISQKQLEASERVTSRTSELAKAVARFAADATNGSVQISPIAIDTVLQGYLGTTASLSMAVADQALNPNRADRPLHQIVGATPFAYDPVGTRRATEFYELREKVVQSQNTLNRLIKQDPERAAEYYERNAERLALYKMVNSTLQQLEDSRKYKQWLDTEMAAETMSSAERMKMKQEVQAYEQKLVEWVRDAKNEMKL